MPPGATGRFEFVTPRRPMDYAEAAAGGGGWWVTYATGSVKAPAAPPVVEIVQATGGDFQSTDKLRVAKWENAFVATKS